jgi:hypothetical protein
LLHRLGTRLSDMPDALYSPKCLVEEFSEVRQEFIGNSSPLASVVALCNMAGLITPPLVKGSAYEAFRVLNGGGPDDGGGAC